MEKKILSKEEFLKGISETARVHYPKFYEKFVLNFDSIEAMETTIELLINVAKSVDCVGGAPVSGSPSIWTKTYLASNLVYLSLLGLMLPFSSTPPSNRYSSGCAT